MKKKTNNAKATDGRKPSGFLNRETYFLVKEWLMKIDRAPARTPRSRKDKGEIGS